MTFLPNGGARVCVCVHVWVCGCPDYGPDVPHHDGMSPTSGAQNNEARQCIAVGIWPAIAAECPAGACIWGCSVPRVPHSQAAALEIRPTYGPTQIGAPAHSNHADTRNNVPHATRQAHGPLISPRRPACILVTLRLTTATPSPGRPRFVSGPSPRRLWSHPSPPAPTPRSPGQWKSTYQQRCPLHLSCGSR